MARPRKQDAPEQCVKRRIQEPYSESEWAALPVTLNVDQVARAFQVCSRHVSDNAELYGGHKFGGKWRFGKGAIAKLVGIEG